MPGDFIIDRDAVEAYQVLSRGHHRDEEPSDDIERSAYRIKIFFLGLSCLIFGLNAWTVTTPTHC